MNTMQFFQKANTKKGSKTYSSATILQYVTIVKEFLNNEGCKIYSEDLRQKFKLPKVRRIYEKGLDKSTTTSVLISLNHFLKEQI